MGIFRRYILFIFIFHCILWSMVRDDFGHHSNLAAMPKMVHGENRSPASIQPGGDTQARVRLIQPDSASQVTTFAPTFTWHAIQPGEQIEYRLLIAKTDGKIVFDQWIGSDTSYTISSPDKFEDLNPYYWTISASFNNHQLKSPVWSFWIDQNVVTDLTVTDISLSNNKMDWEPGDRVKINAVIQNSGPIDAKGCYVLLYSGNINKNYFSHAAHRKTIVLDTVFISNLKLNEPRQVTLTGVLPRGFNHLFVRVQPAPGLKDVIYSNNYLGEIKIQTEKRILFLNALALIYKNYTDPEAGEKRLNENDLNQLYQSIINFQHYFWDHTLMLKINIDTLLVDRLLTDDNFTFQDDQWGYYLPAEAVETDFDQRNIGKCDYDMILVYYSWWNSNSSWSGYSGYTFKNQKLLGKKKPFLAQPVTPGQPANEFTAIHEFLHWLDIAFDDSGERDFYSPHHRTLYTTFNEDKEYFDWMLETWHSEKWLQLKQGQLIQKNDIINDVKMTQISLAPNTIILSQNYPNPFNNMTTISYKIPKFTSSPATHRIVLSIYDILGNRIRTLVNDRQKPGTYRVFWDGKDEHGNGISSGIYFYELRGGEQRRVKKLLFLR